MFDVFGIDIVDIFEIVGPYLTSAGGLGGLLWKQGRDKKRISKDFDDKYIKMRELDEKEHARRDKQAEELEVKKAGFNKDLSKYAIKEMSSIKDMAYMVCSDSVNHLIAKGETQVDRIVLDEVFALNLAENSMSVFDKGIIKTLAVSIEEMKSFIEFETISSYDGERYYNAVMEKADDISRVWLNTLKTTGIVDVYRFALETAISERVLKSVERIYNRCLVMSDNQNVDLVLRYYKLNTVVQSNGEPIEQTETPVISDSPFNSEWN